MTKILKIRTGSKYEEHGSYSRVVAVGDTIHVSNTAGRNPETQQIPEDITEQTLQVFANIERALAAAGSCLGDVVFSRVFIQNSADTMAVMTVVGQKFRGINPATTITCPPLGSDIYKVELEMTAHRGAAQADVEVITLSL